MITVEIIINTIEYSHISVELSCENAYELSGLCSRLHSDEVLCGFICIYAHETCYLELSSIANRHAGIPFMKHRVHYGTCHNVPDFLLHLMLKYTMINPI